VLQSLLETTARARSLCLFPTKALCQDQSRGLNELIEALGEAGTLHLRRRHAALGAAHAARRGHVVLTNPWMLHAGHPAQPRQVVGALRDLRYVVIDEVHTLSGVFGSSVANVLRRLVRIARHYGASRASCSRSATVREPAEHARSCSAARSRWSARTPRPRAAHFGVYNPPLLEPVAGLRANALEEARRLARTCAARRTRRSSSATAARRSRC
jgi:DEAD/DEAH box helicase domain-containing protein